MRSTIYRRSRRGIQLVAMVALHWHLGDVVRKLRELRGYKSQEALGEAAGGLDKGTINRLETRGEEGSTPETIKRVARVLNVDVSDLYGMVPTAPTRATRAADAQTRERDQLWLVWDEETRARALRAMQGIAALAPPPSQVDREHTEPHAPATSAKASGTGTRKKHA